MSSTRLEIPNKLLESLEHLYQATLAYKTEHTADGLYEELLQKPLRVQRNNTRIDFVDDFETNFALISRAQEKVISSNHINTQVIYAGSLPTPIAKLISCNKLLKTAFAHVINKQKSDTNSNEAERDESSAKKELLINAEKIKICNDTITELDNLKLHAEGILLIGYKNHFNSLITLLHKLEAAPQHYKEEHQADHLYEEALINPCKFLVEAKLDFVQDFLKNCDSLQSHSNDFEEKNCNISQQLAAVKKLDEPITHLLEELSLFQKAPKANQNLQKDFEEAITDLEHLKILSERLSILKRS